VSVVGCVTAAVVTIVIVLALSSTRQALECDVSLDKVTHIPDFGLAMKTCWFDYLAGNVTFLNHGSFGAAAIPVLGAVSALRSSVDTNPDDFFRNRLAHEQRLTAQHLADYVHADAHDVVQVEDATSGINAVLQSLLLHRNDTNSSLSVLVDSFAYPSVRNTLQYVIDGPLSVSLDVVQLPFPVNASTIRDEFRAALAKKNYTLVMVDHISSVPAVIFPVHDIVQDAHENGALVFVDGAHAVGQLPLNLTELGADFYVSNTHKWLCAQRSAAFLHVAPAVQHLVHPDAISNHYGEGFLAEFDYIGTRDYSTMIGQRYALELRNKVGDHRWRSYNNDLCDDAAAYLSGHWDSAEIANEEFSSLVMVGPLPYKKNDTVLDWNVELMYKALVSRGIWTVLVSGLDPYPDNRYFRVSCQVYNVLDDYKFLAKQFDEVIDSGEARK